MRPAGGAHLCYCTNIHPAETWPEVRNNLERYVLEVKARVAADEPFGVGLRLSEPATRELCAPEALDECKNFLSCNGLYVFTINAFPYGRFHGTRVKENVYLPDWLSDERLDYTNLAAHALSVLMSDDGPSYGSVSTVPGAFRKRVEGDADLNAIAGRLIAHAAWLIEIERKTGRRICLAVEPEPCCILETAAETVAFFEQRLFSRDAVLRLSGLTGLDQAGAENALRRHLGVCLDACHAAVEFEELPDMTDALGRAGIKIAKIQLSAGLAINPVTRDSTAELRKFDEQVYLHQVVERRGDEIVRYTDIAEAIADAPHAPPPSDTREWRVHFHVPIFLEKLATFDNTQRFLRELLKLQQAQRLSEHLEVETYTWHVLPEEYRGEPVAAAIARELAWVSEELSR